MILTVFLSNNEQILTEVPITPETTCRDVVEFCKEPGEGSCHLAEVWRGNGMAWSGRGSRPSRRTSGWGRSQGNSRRSVVGGHLPKYPDFPAHSWEEPDARTSLRRQPCGRRHKMKGHWHSLASFGKSHRFHTQLDKRPVIPWTTREASRVPFLHSRRGLTLRSQLWRDPVQLQLSGSMCQLIGLWAIVTCITFKPEHLVAAARSSSFGSTCQGQLWSILLRWGIKTWYKVTYVEQNP